MLVGGLIISLVGSDMFQDMMSLDLAIPSIVSTIAIVLAAIGAVGIIFVLAAKGSNLRPPPS